MRQNNRTLQTLTLYLKRGGPHYPSLSGCMGNLPVTLTIRQGRITQTSAWFDLMLEGEGEDVQKAAERIRNSFRPFEQHLYVHMELIRKSGSESVPLPLPVTRISFYRPQSGISGGLERLSG